MRFVGAGHDITKVNSHWTTKVCNIKFPDICFSVHLYKQSGLHVILPWYSFYKLMHVCKRKVIKASNSKNIFGTDIRCKNILQVTPYQNQSSALCYTDNIYYTCIPENKSHNSCKMT